jgi:hypothetical protein
MAEREGGRLEPWPEATSVRSAILRDASLRDAPQDEVRRRFAAIVLAIP